MSGKPLTSMAPEERRALLAQLIAKKQAATSPLSSITPEERRALLAQLVAKKQATTSPLSFAQQRLWFLDQFDPDSTVYNIPLALSIRGELNQAALVAALQDVVRRHDTLRTSFHTVDGQAVQQVAPSLQVPLTIVNLQTVDAKRREEMVKSALQKEIRTPFDLSQSPLLRARLLVLAPQEHIFLLTMHHIISDGWSIRVLINELFLFYQAYLHGQPASLAPLPIQYADFARWQRTWLQGTVLEKQLAYWRAHLQDAPALLALPTDYPRPAYQTFRGARVSFTLPGPLRDQLKHMSQREGVTLFMTLLATFQVLLLHYSGQEQIVVGTPIANRTHTHLEGLIGFFVNTLALHTDLSGNPDFRTVLKRVREVCLGAYDHQDLPFERLVEALQPERSMSYTPIFQVMFALQEPLLERQEQAGLTLEIAEIARSEIATAKFDLSLDMTETPQGLSGVFEYSTDLFERGTIERMVGHLQQVLIQLVARPERPIAELSLLTEAERRQILVEWNATQAPFPRLCMHQIIEAQVHATPDAEAVVYQGTRLSYTELDRRATLIAHHLRAAGVQRDVRVGLYLERSVEQVISVLAVWKAGGAYVPLDPSYPEDRIEFMIKDAQLHLLVTQATLAKQIESGTTPLLLLEDCQEQLNDDPLAEIADPEQLAFMIYTSGSTGTPKGAMITHANLVNYQTFFSTRYQLPTRISAHLQMASFSFDVFVADIVRSLPNGARLVLCPYEQVVDPAQLYALMRREHIDSAEFVPAVLKGLTDYLETIGQRLDFMHLLAAGADTWPVQDYLQTQRLCGPETTLLNVYGLTEATIDNAHFEAGEVTRWPDGAVPIGRPIANTRLYILNKARNPVPIGIRGELYIGGAGVGRGYFQRPELTRERFIPDPFGDDKTARLYYTGDVTRYRSDGTIEFFGRSDQQVKIRGFRIELGEIEGALLRHPAIAEAVVLARTYTIHEKRLVAYISFRGAPISSSELQKYLRETLPQYMIPSAFVFLKDGLPLTPNGKVDRKALPEPSSDRFDADTAYVQPRTTLEEQVARVWSEVLGVERIGAFDNFFSLGGHSLLATRLIFLLARTFNTEIPLRTLFEAPTVAELAEAINRLLSKETNNDQQAVARDLTPEAVLDPSIQGTNPPATWDDAATAIFLTGATGFLGAYLLYELLQSTRAQVYCLVRAETAQAASQKLQRNLSSYQLWHDTFHARIVPVLGDLSHPLFGLTPERFAALATQVDTIYHSGAWVNATYPYEALKPVNVLGTQEVLRLAGQGRTKPVHYISTLSVFSPKNYEEGATVKEDDPLLKSQGLSGGYEQSKWVADKLVIQARQRNIPTTIYRPGLIGGDSQTGIGHTTDMLWAMLKGCIQLGAAPKVALEFDISPVDYVSRGIVYLARHETSSGKAFHFFNHRTVSWLTIIEKARALGYQLELLPYDPWSAKLLAALQTTPENALAPFLPLLKKERFEPGNRAPFYIDDQHTQQALAQTTITCPAAGDLIDAHLHYFRQSHFLPEPVQAAEGRSVGS